MFFIRGRDIVGGTAGGKDITEAFKSVLGLGMVFSLKTHRQLFGSAEHAEDDEEPWPIGLALATAPA
ncbi:MAG: hypothetical protein MUC41_08240 [Syntrophobacteraceae bacterium]|nr:hypothetical protein [Syntrophobacteraceae bacterium]